MMGTHRVPISLFGDSNLACGRIVTAVIDDCAGLRIDKLDGHAMFAAGPSGQPDRAPLIDELRCAAVNRIAYSIVTAVALKDAIDQPEVDHDRIGVLAFVLAFR